MTIHPDPRSTGYQPVSFTSGTGVPPVIPIPRTTGAPPNAIKLRPCVSPRHSARYKHSREVRPPVKMVFV